MTLWGISPAIGLAYCSVFLKGGREEGREGWCREFRMVSEGQRRITYIIMFMFAKWMLFARGGLPASRCSFSGAWRTVHNEHEQTLLDFSHPVRDDSPFFFFFSNWH